MSSNAVAKPVAVRYAWASNPEGANLVNSEGLPASVFRTDDWDDVELVPVDPVAQATVERRALAVEVQALKSRRETLEWTSEEYQTVSKQMREMLVRFKAMAPAVE